MIEWKCSGPSVPIAVDILKPHSWQPVDSGRFNSMLLAVDVGNTNTLFGIAADDGVWSTQWRITTLRSAIGDDWAAIVHSLAARDRVDLATIQAVAVSSVVPMATAGLLQFVERSLGLPALVVHSALDLGISLGMDNPTEVGADRLANAAAAWALEQTATIIVDLGTATKVEAVDASGLFRGGAIAPGLGVSLEALTARAARLFTIELGEPEVAIGRTTVQAMQAGIVRGHLHMIRGLISDIAGELGGESKLIVTGGHAPSLLDSLGDGATHVPDLTLDGIRLIFHRNRTPAAT